MDFSRRVKSYQDFVGLAAYDPDGDMHSEVRNCLTAVCQRANFINIQALRGKAWNIFKRSYPHLIE